MIFIFIIISLLIIIFAELYYIRRARIHNWTSERNSRTDGHPVAVIGGGFIFYLAIILWSLGIGWLYEPTQAMSDLIVGITMLAACSFADDLLQLKVWIRLVVQFIAIIFLCFQFSIFGLSPWIWGIYMVSAVGFVNAYNFMDGINGITGLYSIVVLSALLWVNMNVIHFMSGTFILFALLAAGVFTFFNCRKRAIIFAGDVGSISMGYIITAILSFLIITTGDITAVVFIIVYATDTLLTIIRRIFERENIFMPHHKHAYQLLNRIFGCNQIAISASYASIQAAIIAGYLLVPENLHWHYLATVTLPLTAAWMWITIVSIRRSKQPD